MINEDRILRLREVQAHFKLNNNQFAEKIGIDKSNISKIYNGQRTIGDGIINKIVVNCNVSKEWFLTGQGSMFLPNSNVSSYGLMPVMNVPLVQQYAYAGYLCGYADPEYISELPTVPFIVDHEAKGSYLCFEVRGDSMYDGTEESLLEGDKLLCREIKRELWTTYKLHIRKWDFVIVHRTDGILVKRISEHNLERGSITVHSLNPEYPDRVIRLDDICQIFNVIEVSRARKR